MSDARDGPYAGVHRLSALEFLARWVDHVPERDDAERAEVERVSDARDGPYAGVHRLSALEFLARGVDHVPERDDEHAL